MRIELLERQVVDWKHQSAANSQFAVVVLPCCNVDEDEAWKRVCKKILNTKYEILSKISNTSEHCQLGVCHRRVAVLQWWFFFFNILFIFGIVNNKTFPNTNKRCANTSKQLRNTSKQRWNTSKQCAKKSKQGGNTSKLCRNTGKQCVNTSKQRTNTSKHFANMS